MECEELIEPGNDPEQFDDDYDGAAEDDESECR